MAVRGIPTAADLARLADQRITVRDHACNPPRPRHEVMVGQQWRCPCGSLWRLDQARAWRPESQARVAG